MHVHRVSGVERNPIYIIDEDVPREFTHERFINGVPLSDLLATLGSRHLYLVDYASVPGKTRLTQLA